MNKGRDLREFCCSPWCLPECQLTKIEDLETFRSFLCHSVRFFPFLQQSEMVPSIRFSFSHSLSVPLSSSAFFLSFVFLALM